MSAIETLTRADEKLATQIDAVADAVRSIGCRTAAAKERLAAALNAAGESLAASMQDVAAMLGLTAAAFDAFAGDELLALPAPAALPEPAVATVAAEETPADNDEAPVAETPVPVNRVAGLVGAVPSANGHDGGPKPKRRRGSKPS